MKGVLQTAFDEAIAKLPWRFLEELVERKLSDAGVEPRPELIREVTERIKGGSAEAISIDSSHPDVVISFGDDDLLDLHKQAGELLKRIPTIVQDLTERLSNKTGRALKRNWPEQRVWEEQNHEAFQERLEERWGKALDLLRILLTVSRDIGETYHRKRLRSRSKKFRHQTDVLSRLHARACRVTSEVILLMEAGYADGAFARWRTLYEIGVVATLIAEYDDDLAKRYLLHDIVESWRALRTYMATYVDLGYEPLSKRDIQRTNELYETVIKQYGREFASQYGWASAHLKLSKPTFSDLERSAQRSRMRSHYKMACQNVHAGIKGLTHQLGVIGASNVVLAGASNAGLEEPGQNTTITLAQITFTLFGPPWQLDDTVTLKTLANLQAEAVRAFMRASRKLSRDDAKLRRSAQAQRRR